MPCIPPCATTLWSRFVCADEESCFVIKPAWLKELCHTSTAPSHNEARGIDDNDSRLSNCQGGTLNFHYMK